jgi:beta-glucanase (GH16 family)
MDKRIAAFLAFLGANSRNSNLAKCGEIDIMEFEDGNPTTILGTVHGPGYSGGNAVSKKVTLNDRFDTSFHVVGGV